MAYSLLGQEQLQLAQASLRNKERLRYVLKKRCISNDSPACSAGKIATGCLQFAALQLVAPGFPAPGHHRKSTSLGQERPEVKHSKTIYPTKLAINYQLDQ